MAIYYRSVGAIRQATDNKPVQRDTVDQVNGTSTEAHLVLTARTVTTTPARTSLVDFVEMFVKLVLSLLGLFGWLRVLYAGVNFMPSENQNRQAWFGV
jgi:hypothetical protein